MTTMLNEKYHIGHSTIQFECDAHEGSCCEQRDLYCCQESQQVGCSDHNHEDEDGQYKRSKQQQKFGEQPMLPRRAKYIDKRL